MRTSIPLAIAGSVLLISLLGHAAEPKKPALSKQELDQHTALLAEFKKAKTSPEKRLELIGKAERSLTLKSCLDQIEKEFNKPLADYRQQFMKAAGRSVARRTAPTNLQEIADLRSKVLALSKQEDLKREQIVAESDPALKRLKELLLFDREDVLKQEPELAKKRQSLFVLGEQWEKCTERLLEKLALEEAAAAKAKDPGGDAAKRKPFMATPTKFEDYLAKEEEIATALAMPMDAATRSVLAANAQLANKLDPEEARCILDLNLTRNLLGLPPLRIDLALAAASRDHSSDMETLNFFSHDSPVPGKSSPRDRAVRAGTTVAGENIAAGTVDGAVANQLWWHSPGHHKNMLADRARVGVGASGKYWTEMFGQ